MASFPGSVYNPSLKSAGQTIQAAWFNDPDAEIVAMQDGYRNATAPLNSSNSTVVALSVTGGSTFAVRPTMPPPHAARVALASTVTLGDGVSTVLTWTTGDFLTNSSMFSAPSSMLTPQSTGLWHATAQVAFSPASGGDRAVYLLDSSGTSIGRAQCHASSHASSPTVLNLSATKRFDALGGGIKVQVYQASASTLSVIIADSFFELRKL